MNKQFSFLAGLPRTGSTLLSSILSQNPQIHSEGNSHVCQLMWNTYWASVNENGTDWNPDILLSDRQSSIEYVISSIPSLYYNDVKKRYILDKSRTWTLPGNTDLLKKFVTDKPKILVLLRPLDEIISSFVRIRAQNGRQQPNLYEELFNPALLSEIEGVLYAKQHNNGEFLFVHYDDIVFNTKKTLSKIYDFCEWPKFEHVLNNITRSFVQNDYVYNLNGLHDVRKTVEKQKYHIELPKNILKTCYYYNSLIFED